MPRINCRRLENHKRSVESGFCLSPAYCSKPTDKLTFYLFTLIFTA